MEITRSSSRSAIAAVLATLGAALAAAPFAATGGLAAAAELVAAVDNPAQQTLHVESGPSGLTVRADNARLEDVLDALAAEASFEVYMQRGMERPPVDVNVRDASVEEALRRILRRRNYALVYHETDGGPELDQVRVLRPPEWSPPPTPSAAQRRRQRLEARRARR